VAAAPLPAGGKIPRKFKVPLAPPTTARVEGGDAKVTHKVKRDHVAQWDKRRWQTSQSLFYPYDKIKNDFELQGLFTRMKDKCWMVIYFDMILMYLPTKEGPPDMEDKLEGKPFAYFFIDNIVDSDKIVADDSKLSIFLPTQNSKDDLRIICDTPQQFKVRLLMDVCCLFFSVLFILVMSLFSFFYFLTFLPPVGVVGDAAGAGQDVRDDAARRHRDARAGGGAAGAGAEGRAAAV
jgi:hypothetical protein